MLKRRMINIDLERIKLSTFVIFFFDIYLLKMIQWVFVYSELHSAGHSSGSTLLPVSYLSLTLVGKKKAS